jgi:hypothetical protein
VTSTFSLAVQLGVATLMVLATVIIHACGLALLGRLLRIEAFQEATHHVAALSPRTLGFTLILVLALFALHGVEIWAYAALYLGLGAIGDLAGAVYFSTITYATIGFSDSELAAAWRLVAAIEGINGILLLGWSTAFFVAVVARLGGARGL